VRLERKNDSLLMLIEFSEYLFNITVALACGYNIRIFIKSIFDVEVFYVIFK
jgi:hypothetical protein